MVQDFKASVNTLNDQGTTPLFHAVSEGKRSIADFLVEHGKIFNIQNVDHFRSGCGFIKR